MNAPINWTAASLAPGLTEAMARVPASWRRRPEPTHVYTFNAVAAISGAPVKETRPTDRELAAVFLGPGATPEWCGVFQWDEFRERIVAVNPPMRLDAETRGLTDADLREIKLWLSCRASANVSTDRVSEAIHTAANHCRFHPVRDYFNHLELERETPPADALAYFRGIAGRLWGAAPEDDETESAMFMRQCIAAVRRIWQPGTKVDKMLILQGEQGFGKSRLLAKLFGEFFTDELPGDWSNRDAPHALRGKWGVELGELAAWPKNEEEVKKAFLTRQEDIYREYGTGNEIRRLRACTFWGTTNADAFLRDATGSRRYDILHVRKRIDVDAFDRDDLWAAAVTLEAAGELHYLETESGAEEERRQEHAVTDPWDGPIAGYLRDLHAKGQRYVSPADALTVAVFRPIEHQTPADLKRVQNILRRLCGDSKPCKPGGRGSKTVRMYVIPDPGELEGVAPGRARVAAPGELFRGGTVAPVTYEAPSAPDAPRGFQATA